MCAAELQPARELDGFANNVVGRRGPAFPHGVGRRDLALGPQCRPEGARCGLGHGLGYRPEQGGPERPPSAVGPRSPSVGRPLFAASLQPLEGGYVRYGGIRRLGVLAASYLCRDDVACNVLAAVTFHQARTVGGSGTCPS